MDYPVPGHPGPIGDSRPPVVDTDCDGYADERDKCPNEAGPYNGCPYTRSELCRRDARGLMETGNVTAALGILIKRLPWVAIAGASTYLIGKAWDAMCE